MEVKSSRKNAGKMLLYILNCWRKKRKRNKKEEAAREKKKKRRNSRLDKRNQGKRKKN